MRATLPRPARATGATAGQSECEAEVRPQHETFRLQGAGHGAGRQRRRGRPVPAGLPGGPALAPTAPPLIRGAQGCRADGGVTARQDSPVNVILSY